MLYNPQYIAGCTIRNTLRVVQSAIYFKKKLYFYIAGLYNPQYILKEFCIFTLWVVQPAIHLKKKL